MHTNYMVIAPHMSSLWDPGLSRLRRWREYPSLPTKQDIYQQNHSPRRKREKSECRSPNQETKHSESIGGPVELMEWAAADAGHCPCPGELLLFTLCAFPCVGIWSKGIQGQTHTPRWRLRPSSAPWPLAGLTLQGMYGARPVASKATTLGRGRKGVWNPCPGGGTWNRRFSFEKSTKRTCRACRANGCCTYICEWLSSRDGI